MKPGDLLTVATIGGPSPAHYVRPLGRRLSRDNEFHLATLIYPAKGKQSGNTRLFTEGRPRRFHKDDIELAQICRVCGCSDFFACSGPVFAPDGKTVLTEEPCHWVSANLCSRCAYP